MLSSMGFKAIDPTISNAITELFLLPVQNILQQGKKGLHFYLRKDDFSFKVSKILKPDLREIRLFLIIESSPENPFFYSTLLRFDLK